MKEPRPIRIVPLAYGRGFVTLSNFNSDRENPDDSQLGYSYVLPTKDTQALRHDCRWILVQKAGYGGSLPILSSRNGNEASVLMIDMVSRLFCGLDEVCLLRPNSL